MLVTVGLFFGRKPGSGHPQATKSDGHQSSYPRSASRSNTTAQSKSHPVKLFRGNSFVHAIAVALLFSGANTVHAFSLRTQRDVVVVNAVDVRNRNVVLTLGSSPAQIRFYWDRSTTFLRDGRPSGPGELAPGMRATATHVMPIWGKHFITRISWESRKGSASTPR